MIQLSDKNRAKEIGGNYQQLLNLRFQTDVKIFGTGLNTMVLGKKNYQCNLTKVVLFTVIKHSLYLSLL